MDATSVLEVEMFGEWRVHLKGGCNGEIYSSNS